MPCDLGEDSVPAPAFMDDADILPRRRKQINREHILQKHIKLFVRDAVDGAEFFAFDRAPAAYRLAHVYEKSRGLRHGTPDTLLRVRGVAPIWCELKHAGSEPDTDQKEMGRRLIAVGDIWFWTTSVAGYYRSIKAYGVPMRSNAELMAQHHDACVAGLIAKAEAARGAGQKTAKRPRKAPPRFVGSAAFGKRVRVVRGML